MASSNAVLTVLVPPAITAHPAGVTVGDGVTVVLTVAATGTSPLGYQWRYNGTNIVNGGSVSGATLGALTILNAQPSQSGTYSVVVSNLVGTVVSSNAVLVVRAALAISEALDADYLFWNASMSAPWQAQTAVTHDGIGAVRSGPIGSNAMSWLETTVLGPGTIRFWWKVSSETNKDFAQFLLGGVLRDAISGEVDWQYRSVDVPGGQQTLGWSYLKDASGNAGQDRAWLDEVEFVPVLGPSVPVITKHPAGLEVASGATVSFSAEAVGTPPLSYQWTYNGVELIEGGTVSGAAGPILNLAGVDATREGTYKVVVRNNYSLAVSSNAFLHVLPAISLNTALDVGTTNMLFVTGGNSAWFGEDVFSHDRRSAAQSGQLLNLQTNYMEATVTGPIAVSFWWKVSSQTNSDRLRFYINGIEQANVSGEVDWRWRTFDVSLLSARLRWAYTKDASGSAGLDAGWIDEITTGPMAPVVTNGPNNVTWVDEGSLIKLRVESAGTPPFSYQWRLAGTNLLESTNFLGAQTSRTLILTNSRAWQAGIYSCLVSNAAGISLSDTGYVFIIPGRPLPPALNTPTWVWRTGGEAWWIGDRGDSHDGVESGRSGSLVSSSGSTWMETTVTGAGQLRFWWKTSSRTNQDFARFYINDTEMTSVSGTPNWQQKVFDVNGGTNVFRWDYTRNGILTNGQNHAYVDEVFFGPVPPVITNQPASQVVDAGSTVQFGVGVRGTPPFTYRWRLNGLLLSDTGNISGSTASNLTITGVLTNQAGNYSVLVNNSTGAVISANALLTVTPVLPLDQALDTTNMIWSISGSPAWVGQPIVSHDGVDAARIAGVPDGGSATLQTTITGPGTISFWWKVSSEATRDLLRFYIGSGEQANISGEVDWAFRTFTLPAGNQTIKWTYAKNSSLIAGQDRAWIDQVVFNPMPPLLTTQPVSRSVDQGEDVTFSVAADGTPPFTYQWRFNNNNLGDGANITGATMATLSLTGVLPAQAGNYSVVVRNAAGAATSSNAPLAVATIVPLADALDDAGLTWTTSGNPPWVGQTAVSHDGTDAARSGAIAHSGTTTIQTTLTGPGTITFWWKVSSEATKDFLRFYVGTTEMAAISGEVEWESKSFNLNSGSQTVKWTYSKNSSISVGLDRGWVDQVQFAILPPTIAVAPTNRTVEAGSTLSFMVVPSGTPTFTYQWLRNGIPLANGAGISGVTTSNLTLTAVQTAQAGTYSVIVSNSVGSATSAGATLTVAPTFDLATALDTTGITWTTNGNPPWIGQAATTHDGSDAARSGAIADSSSTTFQTTLTGPGTITFWWKISSESGADFLRFYLNGTKQTEISGEVNWELKSFNLGSGSQTLQWTYSKNGSGVAGQDRGWVDQVQFGILASVIATAPVDQVVEAGTTANFKVVPAGTPPFTYQWLLNGSALANGTGISGATTSNLTLTAVQTAQAGRYSVIVGNSAGSATSAGATLTVTPTFDLATALDSAGITWNTNSTPPWIGQAVITHDGIDAARSGPTPDSGNSSFFTTLTGPGTLTFWWKVSSESGADFLRFYLNGTKQAEISGEVDWQLASYTLSSGSQSLEWRYKKSASGAAGQDRGWVDEVQFGILPPAIAVAPTDRSVEAGSTVSFVVVPAGTAPFTYQWLRNGTPLANGAGTSGVTTSNLTLTAVQTAQAGTYAVIVSNSAGIATSAGATLIVMPTFDLATALDTAGITWTTNGNPPWIGQAAVTHDGTDAARSGAIADSGSTTFQTTLTGPGTIMFWWKISSESGADFLPFLE